jgi:DNA polymerase V
MAMSRPRKIIPVVAAPQMHAPDTEMQGCAELEPYALRVVGDSMAPEFLDGHIIVLDPGLRATHGAYVVMDVAGETVFRQFWKLDERVLLKALNPAYVDIELRGNYQLRGVVTQRAGRRRADRKHYD